MPSSVVPFRNPENGIALAGNPIQDWGTESYGLFHQTVDYLYNECGDAEFLFSAFVSVAQWRGPPFRAWFEGSNHKR
jgi:hypothetical protein